VYPHLKRTVKGNCEAALTHHGRAPGPAVGDGTRSPRAGHWSSLYRSVRRPGGHQAVKAAVPLGTWCARWKL